jgi:hypothetical protein
MDVIHDGIDSVSYLPVENIEQKQGCSVGDIVGAFYQEELASLERSRFFSGGGGGGGEQFW